MKSPRLFMLSAATGAALAFGSAFIAPAASAGPVSPECFQAQANVASQENNVDKFTTQLSNDNVVLQNAKDKLAKDQAAVPVDPDLIKADQDAVSAAQQAVNTDQASLRTAKANLAAAVATRDAVCNPAPTTTPTPTPTTTPPPPVGGGVPVYPTCAAAFAAGVHDIPRGDPRYRVFLDRDRDGVACELNGDDGVRPQRPIIVNPPSQTTIVNPPAPPGNTTVAVPPAQGPVFVAPQAPSTGAVATGDGSLA